MKDFHSADLKAQVKAAIVAIETKSSAEIVVSVRPRSDAYRDADFAFGSVFAGLLLTLLIFLPEEFNEKFFPLEVAMGFAVGTLFSANVWLVKKLFVRPARFLAMTKLAACKHFLDARLGRTRDRSAILVFVSLFEGVATLVVDTGLEDAKVGSQLRAWEASLTAAIKRGDAAAFAAALPSIATELGVHYPRSNDDTNELSDEVDG